MPRYTFFFPEEEYHPTLMEPLAEMFREGIADVEVHIHHDGEGRQNFVDRISNFCQTLRNEHGLLRKRDGKLAFGSSMATGPWTIRGRMDACAGSTMKSECFEILAVMPISQCHLAILQPKLVW